MGNKIVTEADRKRTPQPQPLPGYTLRTPARLAFRWWPPTHNLIASTYP